MKESVSLETRDGQSKESIYKRKIFTKRRLKIKCTKVIRRCLQIWKMRASMIVRRAPTICPAQPGATVVVGIWGVLTFQKKKMRQASRYITFKKHLLSFSETCLEMTSNTCVLSLYFITKFEVWSPFRADDKLFHLRNWIFVALVFLHSYISVFVLPQELGLHCCIGPDRKDRSQPEQKSLY